MTQLMAEREGIVARLLFQPGPARALAAVRIAGFGGILVVTEPDKVAGYASLPKALITAPPGLGWLVGVLPWGAWATVGAYALLACSLAAMLGWKARVTMPVAVALALWILLVPSLFGKVKRLHHVIWLAGIAAVTPSTDALALDSRRRRVPGDSVAYGFPVRVGWAVLGACYLFPGLHKLAAGPQWWASDNLTHWMWSEWLEVGRVPWRVDQLPAPLLWGAALGAVAFEVAFLALVWVRRARPWLIVAGVALHVAIWAFMHINFMSLVLAYLILVPWRGRPPEDREPSRLSVGVCVGLLIAVFLAGAVNLRSGWPVAAYPTIAAVKDRPVTVPQTELEVDGRVVQSSDVFGGWMSPARFTALLDSNHDQLEVIAQETQERVGCDRVRIVVRQRSTVPGEGGRVIAERPVGEARC